VAAWFGRTGKATKKPADNRPPVRVSVKVQSAHGDSEAHRSDARIHDPEAAPHHINCIGSHRGPGERKGWTGPTSKRSKVLLYTRRDFASYLDSFWREWRTLLIGGSIMALVALLALGANKPIPAVVNWLIVGLTFLLASFSSWRRERSENMQRARDMIAIEQQGPVRARIAWPWMRTAGPTLPIATLAGTGFPALASIQSRLTSTCSTAWLAQA
jgi:hypothetical protein